jgi:hypothetical protein
MTGSDLIDACPGALIRHEAQFWVRGFTRTTEGSIVIPTQAGIQKNRWKHAIPACVGKSDFAFLQARHRSWQGPTFE